MEFIIPKSIPYDDFRDPDVVVWENIGYADNYYQNAAINDFGPLPKGTVSAIKFPITFTPNGREVSTSDFQLGVISDSQADLNVFLGGRKPPINTSPTLQQRATGFTIDYINPIDLFENFLGLPHSRVWQWYSGTANLNTLEIDDNPIFRKLGDAGKHDFVFNDFETNPHLYNPWYQPESISTWEGIQQGWYLSQLGGGSHQRTNSQKRTSISTDNTDKIGVKNDVGVRNQDVVVKRGGSFLPIPSIFNGNFELGTLHLYDGNPNIGKIIPNPIEVSGRFPFLSNETPGWSFHGGTTAITNAARNFIVKKGGTKDKPNHVLELNSYGSINGERRATHNRMFLPDGVDAVSFRYWIEEASETD
ncbi:hypothetical protein, partial [Crocosphaera watsonii]